MFLVLWQQEIGSLLKENVLQWRSFVVTEESRFGWKELERKGSAEAAGADAARADEAFRVTAAEFRRAQDPGQSKNVSFCLH